MERAMHDVKGREDKHDIPNVHAVHIKVQEHAMQWLIELIHVSCIEPWGTSKTEVPILAVASAQEAPIL